MSERLFKVLGDGMEPFHGGKGRWLAGRWMPPVANIQLCRQGYHLCREQDLVLWLGPTIYEAEWRGERIDDSDKIVVSEARTVRRLTTWNERTARLFAADCAEHVAHLADADTRRVIRKTLSVVRRFADGAATVDELAAAAETAWAAWTARAAWTAWAARAAGAAETAWAAWAAWAAAGAAAGAAEREWQTNRLMEILYPKEG